MQIKDQLQRTLTIPKTPKRIISLVPSITELICDLGLQDDLIGVTKFCVHPKTIREEAAVIGGTKQVHLDEIQALNPDIILCNKEENTETMVASLEAISNVHISDINTVSDCLELIMQYGVIFNVSEKAKPLVSKIKKEQAIFADFIIGQPKRTVAYFIWKGPWMVVGHDTFIDYMLSLNNLKNGFYDKSRYPEISLEKIYPNVDFVFLSSEPFPFKKAHKPLLRKAFPNAKMIIVDGEMFSWYGSRLLLAFKYFKQLHKTVLI